MSQQIVLSLASLLLSAAVAYFTTTYSLRREMRHGAFRLVELCRRYLINFLNAFDRTTKDIKADKLSRNLYVAELRIVVSQLDSLLDNSYVGRLSADYPLVSVLLVQIRRELGELETHAVLQSLNPGTVGAVASLYRRVKADLPRKYTRNVVDTDLDQSIDVLVGAGAITIRK